MMKKISILCVLIAFIAIGFTSCKDDSDYRPAYYSYGTIVSTMGGNLVKFDGGGTAYPKIGIKLDEGYSSGDRVLIFYYILNENQENTVYQYEIEIYDGVKIPIDQLVEVPSTIEDTLGTNPFLEAGTFTNQVWVTDDYITMIYCYAGMNPKMHSVALASYHPEDILPTSDTIYLEFRHNAHGDPKQNAMKSIVSYRLNRYQVAGGGKDSVVLAIKTTETTDMYESTGLQKTKYVVYKWGSAIKHSSTGVGIKPKDIQLSGVSNLR